MINYLNLIPKTKISSDCSVPSLCLFNSFLITSSDLEKFSFFAIFSSKILKLS
jgi:hypothetical protein